LSFGTTPSQTVGPYFAIGLPWEGGEKAVDPGADGAIRITGTVVDGAGDAVADSLIETWQVDPQELFARCGYENGDGTYEIFTLKPGGEAPYIDVSVFARGMLNRCVTRIYFDLSDVPEFVPAERRETLLAARVDGSYRFDIHLQGPNETVFFDV
jgi:protocatechuate 3,4-dioxygenase alpha subunit